MYPTVSISLLYQILTVTVYGDDSACMQGGESRSQVCPDHCHYCFDYTDNDKANESDSVSKCVSNSSRKPFMRRY